MAGNQFPYDLTTGREVGSRLKACREAAGMTQKQVAAELKLWIPPSRIPAFEKGYFDLGSLQALIKLSHLFGKPFFYWFQRGNSMTGADRLLYRTTEFDDRDWNELIRVADEIRQAKGMPAIEVES